MAEAYILEQAMNDPAPPSFDVLERRVVIVPDSNNGAYTNSVTFSLANCANNGNYIDWLNSYASIPLVLVEAQGTARLAAAELTPEGSMAMSLKNGNHCIFNGITLRLSGVDLLNNVNLSNLKISYEIMSSFTDSDLEQAINFGCAFENGETYLIGTETAGTSVSNSNIGIGVCNNNLAPYAPDLSLYSFGVNSRTSFNSGRLKRIMTVYDMTVLGANGGLTSASGSWTNKLNAVMTTDSVASLKSSYFALNSLQYRVWYFYAKLPFAILHDYFRQVPLTKNSFYEMVLYLHTGVTCVDTQVAAGVAAATKVKKIQNPAGGFSVTTPYGYNPIQFSSLAAGNGNDSINDANATRTAYLTICKPHSAVASSVTSAVGSNAGNHPEGNCKLYMHMVKLRADRDAQYLSNKIRTVSYLDVKQPTLIQNVAPGATITQLIESSQTKLRKMVIMPYLSAVGVKNLSTATTVAANAFGSTAQLFDPLTSPYDGFGNMFLSSPGAYVSNFNVLMAGIPMYQNGLNTAEEFYFEYVKTTLNGGVPSSMSKGGQIDFTQWLNQHSVIVTDFTNYRNPSSDDVAKTVQVTLKNVCRQQCNYLVWLYYERSIRIDVESGTLDFTGL